MKSWRLSANDKKVLAVAQKDSRKSVESIAAQARMRHHSVAYTLKRLKDRRIIRPYIHKPSHRWAYRLLHFF